MNRRQFIAASVAAIAPTTVASIMQAQDFVLPYSERLVAECGNFWPSRGAFEAYTDGYECTATLEFQLSHSNKAAALCVASGLELHFRFSGFNVPPRWSGYWVDDNLPGSVAGPYLDDGSSVAMPRISSVAVSDLRIGRQYYASVGFSDLEPNGDGAPRVSFEIAPTRDVCSNGCYHGSRHKVEISRLG